MLDKTRKTKHYHLIGIAGIGMSGIARILLAQGHRVSGSDLVANALTKSLEQLGASISLGHGSKEVDQCDVVIRSSAISEMNPEYQAAQSKGLTILERADSLASIIEPFQRIVIAGSHGKTTTTSLAAHLLQTADHDPSYIIGGVLTDKGVNAHLGKSDYMVVESDESDGSFVKLSADIAIVTNIDSDHLSHYQQDMTKLDQAFCEFMQQSQPNALIIACVDNVRLQALLPQIDRRILTYSVERKPADYRAEMLSTQGGRSHFICQKPDGQRIAFELNLPGQHNVSNALAVIMLGDELGLTDKVIHNALANFPGVGRRFETHYLKALTVVDDYGHHPCEMLATLKAARANWPGKKIHWVFQPHRYSRTKELFDEFVSVLSLADAIILLDIHSANEKPMIGADSDALALALEDTLRVKRLSTVNQLLDHAKACLAPDDILIMQGAGSIGAMVQPFLDGMDVATRRVS